MEELTELAKKQLRFQKSITGLLAALLVAVLAIGISFVGQVKQMSTAIKSSAERVQEIDVDAINQTVWHRVRRSCLRALISFGSDRSGDGKC